MKSNKKGNGLQWVCLMLLAGLFWTAGPGGLSSNPAQAQDPVNTARRLDDLEAHRKNLDERFKIKTDALDTRFKQHVRETELMLREKYLQLDRDYDHLKQLTWVFGIGSVFGLVIILVGLLKKIPEIAEKKAMERFEFWFHAESKKLEAMMKLHDEEQKLKENTAVLVLTPEPADTRFIRRFFRDMGFPESQVDYETFDPAISIIHSDMVLLNDDDGRFTDNEIARFMDRVPENKVCMYFGKKRVPPGDNHAFANARLQLYPNLINALRYRRWME